MTTQTKEYELLKAAILAAYPDVSPEEWNRAARACRTQCKEHQAQFRAECDAKMGASLALWRASTA